MAQQSSHSGLMFLTAVIAAAVGALGPIGAAYVGLLKPTERQIDASEDYRALVREGESYRAHIQDLTRQLKDLQTAKSHARSEEEELLALEVSRLKAQIQELKERNQSLLSEVGSLSNRLAEAKIAETQGASAPPGAPTTPGPALNRGTLTRPSIDLKTLVGRWVGLAECSRGDRSTSIDVISASASELKLQYSDSLNNGVHDATLILLPTSTGQATFAFRTKDDRFISLKNGHRLVLESNGLLVSPSDASKQCKLALSKS